MTVFRLLLFILAVVVSAIGYANNQIIGLLAGVLLLILALRGLGDNPVPHAAAQPLGHYFRLLARWLRAHDSLALGILATLGSASAAVIASRDPYSLISDCLWLAAVLMILLAALRHDRVGLAQLRAAWFKLQRREILIELGLLGFISLVALILRVYDLEHYPLSLHGDEGEIGALALRVVAGREPLPLWGTTWFDFPNMLYYFKAVSLLLFGTGEVGLRMTAAVIGALGVPLLYWLGRLAWGRLAAVTAAWLMAVSHLAIHYSRSGLNDMEVATGMIAVMLMLALARERAHSGSPDTPRPNRELSLFVGIGLVMAFTQYLYYGARLIPVVVTILLLYLWREKRVSVKQISVVALASFIMFAPMALFYVYHPSTFVSRTETVSIFSPNNVRHTLGANASLPADLPALVRYQLEGTLGFLMGQGDRSGFYSASIPMFDTLTAILSWLGLGVVLTRARRFYEFALLLWLGLGLFLASFLTLDPPNGGRLMIVVPCVFLLGGVFVSRASQFLTAVVPLRSARLGAVTMTLGALLILAVNARLYLVDYMRDAPNLTPIMVAREMLVTPEYYRAFLMGAPNLYVRHGAIRFLASDAHPQDLVDPADLPPPEPGMGTLVVALPNHEAELKLIEERFPGGVSTSITDPVGRLVYLAYRIPQNKYQAPLSKGQ